VQRLPFIQTLASCWSGLSLIGFTVPVWAAEETVDRPWLWLVILLLLVLQSFFIIGLQRSRLVNQRARQELRENKRELEERIIERTDSLSRINEQLQDEIAHHQATEILLRETQDYLHSMINSMPSVLIGITYEGRVTHWNSAAELATGCSSEQALGQPLDQVYPDLPMSLDAIRKNIDSGTPSIRENIKTGHGSEARYSDLSVYPLIAAQSIGAVIRVDDTTERVRLETMMIQNEKMMSLGELAAGMAHEINNPLSTILHGVQNIKRRTSAEVVANQKVADQKGINLERLAAYLQERHIFLFLDNIRDAGERAAHIVKNMLEFSRSNDGHKECFDLLQVIEHSLELSEETLTIESGKGKQKPQLDTQLEGPIAPIVGSAAEIQQVVLNLLRNAIQAFNAQGENNDQPRIQIKAYQQEGQAVLEITDNGPGMSQEVRRHIFDPFFTTKEVGQGTGLGLSVSYFIVTEHHSGRIEVDSELDKGTRFRIHLPLADSVKASQD